MKSGGVSFLKNSVGLVCSVLLFQSTLLANHPVAAVEANLERPVSNLENCDQRGVCEYEVQNTAPSRIQKLINDALNIAFGDHLILFQGENRRPIVSGLRNIIFKFENPDNRQIFLSALTRLDRLPNPSKSAPQVKITFKVYALDSVAYNNLELGLSAFSNSKSPLDAAAPRINLSSSVSNSGIGGILSSGLQLNIGNLTSALFGLKLDLSRLSSWSMNSVDYETVVTNGEGISAYSNTPTYNKGVSSSVSIEKANIGLDLTGRVSIYKDARKLNIENFYVRYAAPTPDENSIMTETVVSRPSIEIELGRPYVLGMKTVLLDATSKGNNFIFAGKSSKNTIASTLMLVVNAQLVRDDSTEQVFAQQEARLSNMTNMDASALDQQLQNSNKTINESLASVGGFVVPVNQAIGSVLFGQVAGIRLKAENIDRSNVDRMITITEKNRVSQQVKTSYVRMLDLVTKGYSFKTLNFADLQVSCQKQQDKCQSLRLELEMSEMDSTQTVRMLATYLPEQQFVQMSRNNDSSAKSNGFFRSFSGPQQD